MSNNNDDHINQYGIAIIGMSCRFPGAKDAESYWDNIAKGVESISFFSKDELKNKGVPQKILDDPNFVPAGGVYDEHDLFDAKFFNLLPREVEILDPQQRLFLEWAYEAWEDAGYTADYVQGEVGVFGGVTMNTYMIEHVIKNPHINDIVGYLQLMIGNDKDFVTTRVSHQLRLTGPSYAVQTACSTSLVAIHHACISLLAGECDMALAGGTSVRYPHGQGYMYFNGGTSSIDGHCRAFDKDASGSVVGNGGGIVVLKRYQDALRDNDHIYAIIRGSATGNDGADKPAYSTPSEIGQARVVTKAITLANIDSSKIGYVEAHGTATNVGDPIEFTALSKAFAKTTKNKLPKQACALGSVKANIGHLDAGAGVSGLIKVIMALRHKKIPPQINFNEINSKIAFDESPFYISKQLQDWLPENNNKRIAGVTSIGLGGANAHVIVEEYLTNVPPRDVPSGFRIFPLTARTDTSLQAYKQKLINYLNNNELNIDDIAFTLQVGRQPFEFREVYLAENLTSLVNALKQSASYKKNNPVNCKLKPKIVFMFPGQGSQYVGMFKTLYENNDVFKQHFHECNTFYQQCCGEDLSKLLLELTDNNLTQTLSLQPLLFAVEYALAKVLQYYGVQPDAVIGHSLGEFVAATMSGVFDLSNAMQLIYQRAVLAQSCEAGRMISVNATLNDVQKYLSNEVELSVVNSTYQCVLGGSIDSMSALEERLKADNVKYTVLKTSHAFHTKLMQPVAIKLLDELNKMKLHKPTVPLVSGILGRIMTANEAKDPHYWANHIVTTLQYQTSVSTLNNKFTDAVFIEVGPGNILSALLHSQAEKMPITINCFKQHHDDQLALAQLLSELWLHNIKINWSGLYRNDVGRISLPTTCFEKKRYFLETGKHTNSSTTIPTQNQIGAKSVDTNNMSNGAKQFFSEIIDLISDRQINLYISSRQESPKENVVSTQQALSIVAKEQSPSSSAHTTKVASNIDNIKETLSNYWRELLGIDHIDEQQSIFDLGAHSLLLTQLLIKINKHYDAGLSLQELLEHPTLEQMTRLVQSKLGVKSAICSANITPSTTEPYHVIREILCNSLGINELQDQDDIYSLGGHSLLLAQILNLIHSRLGVKVNPTELSTTPSLQELVRLVTAKKSSNGNEQIVEDIMTSLDGLSEQEIADLLAEVQ